MFISFSVFFCLCHLWVFISIVVLFGAQGTCCLTKYIFLSNSSFLILDLNLAEKIRQA